MLHILQIKKSIKALESKTVPFCEKFECEAPSMICKAEDEMVLMYIQSRYDTNRKAHQFSLGLGPYDPLRILMGRTSVAGGASSVATAGFIWVYRLEKELKVEAERRGFGKRRFKGIKRLKALWNAMLRVLIHLNLLFPDPLLSASTSSR
ncbi:hypothetical protein OROMI_014031 [Orobanche minor]